MAEGSISKAPMYRIERLRRAMAGAALANLILNPVSAAAATIASPAVAPSLTGYTSMTPLTGGFVASFTGTTVAGSPVITAVSSLSGVVVGQPVIEAVTNYSYPTKIALGSVIIAIDTTAMTITMDRPAVGSATTFSIKTATEKIAFYGGIAGSYGANVVHVSSTGGNYTTPPTLPIQVSVLTILEFETDAAFWGTSAPGIIFGGYRNGISSPKYRIAIDDVYQTTDPQSFDASLDWITIQFATAAVHKVRIEIQAGFCLSKLYLPTGASAWKPRPKPLVGFFGDSWFAGGGNGARAGRNIASQAAELLGVEPFFCSVGGTGYKRDGGTNWPWSNDYRIADTKLRALDAIVMLGSINDNGQGDITANCLTTFQKLRAANPGIPITIFGCPATPSVSVSAAMTIEGYQQSAFASWADNFAWYHPLTGNPGGGVTNSANFATVIGADNAHPTDPAGVQMIGRWMARTIARDWAA